MSSRYLEFSKLVFESPDLRTFHGTARVKTKLYKDPIFSPQGSFPTLQFLASESNCLYPFHPLHLFSPDYMSSHRKTMPSFTLVLTSGHPSFRSPAIDIQPSSAMLPTAPDFLMKTIDLRHHSTDVRLDEGHEDIEAEQKSTNPVKRNFLFLVHKLVSYKQKFITGKTDQLSSPN